MIKHLATPEELQHLQSAFNQLDINNDGKITRDELLEGFLAHKDDQEHVEEVEKEVDAIF